MALDENGNPIPGTVDAFGGFVWPPPEWLVPPPEVVPVPVPPIEPAPVDAAAGRKGGSPSGPERVAAPAGAPREEAPAAALAPPAAPTAGPLPEFNPMADQDPRLDMTPDELAAAQAPAQPAPPNLGELAPDYAGQPAPPVLEERPFNPFEADAISGGTAPTDKRAPSMPAEYESPFEQTVSKVTGATPDDLSKLSPEQLGVAISGLPAEQQAVIKQQWDAAQANYIAGRQLEESHRYLAAMQAANERAAQRTAAVDAEAKRLADINPDGWMDSRTGGQKLAAAIAVIAGGLAAPQMGGRNVGLEMIQQAARENVEAQKANLAKNQARLAGERTSIHDEFDRDAVLQQATYETAIRGLQAEMQKYDPRGSTAMGIAQTIAQVQQAQAQAVQQQHQQRLKDEAAQAKIDLDRANLEKIRAETAKLRGQLGSKPEVDFGAQYKSLNDIPEKLHDRAFRLPSGKWAIANSTESAKEATTFVTQYKQLDYNLNELQKLSIEREGAKSVGGSFSDKWKTDDEQHYKQLLTDAVNRYGMMIHGRAPTQGVLEEVLHAFPDLKSAWERGDTTYLLGKMRDDIDNRGTLQLHAYGANEALKTPRPKPADVNLNSLGAPLLEKPVKGDAGYAPSDVADFNNRLTAIRQHYIDTPQLEGSETYQQFLDRVKQQQEANAAQVRGELPKLTGEQRRAAEKALADIEQKIAAVVDAKKFDIDELRKKKEDELLDKRNQLTPVERMGGVAR